MVFFFKKSTLTRIESDSIYIWMDHNHQGSKLKVVCLKLEGIRFNQFPLPQLSMYSLKLPKIEIII